VAAISSWLLAAVPPAIEGDKFIRGALALVMDGMSYHTAFLSQSQGKYYVISTT
jgi:hypothetical protein